MRGFGAIYKSFFMVSFIPTFPPGLGMAQGSCEQSNKPVQALLLAAEYLGLCAVTQGHLQCSSRRFWERHRAVDYRLFLGQPQEVTK